MVKLEEAVIARLEHAGERFEVLVEPHLAVEVRRGTQVKMDDLLAADTVFRDARKGEKASEEAVKKFFGTNEIEKVVARIIRDGRVQLTTEQRREMLERRRKEVVALVARDALNPQTNSPHPVQRIENALEEAKVQIDPLRPASEQVKAAVEAIRKLIPISIEKLRVAARVPPQFSGKAVAVLHRFNVVREEWQGDGSVIALLEIPAGLKAELFNELNHLTHGSVDIKIIEK